MKIAYYWLTAQGKALTEKVQRLFGGTIRSKAQFSEVVSQDFLQYDALVFIMATGIVIRTIAPLLRSKASDPAVVVLDQQGRYVISLLSGHLGGANALTRKIAAEIHAEPIITTATDVERVVAFDEFAVKNDLVIENLEEVKSISSALLDGKSVEFDTDLPLEESYHLPQIVLTRNPIKQYCVRVSDIMEKTEGKEKHILYLRPKDLVIGIGCKRDISAAHLEQCFHLFLRTYGLSNLSVRKIATIARKREEPAILCLCEKYGYLLEVVSDEAIQTCEASFEVSEFVQQTIGLPSVAEACSYLASNCGSRLTGKVKYSGITLAACRMSLPPLKF